MELATQERVKVADEVWIVTALLHRENPELNDFSVGEIVARAKREKIFGELRPGVYVHVVQHCVANRPPNPGRYRMLIETGRNRRRLFRPGDSYHPAREGSRAKPRQEEIPAQYRPLLDWYESEFVARSAEMAKADPILALRGSGRKLWADEHADQYVRRLREGWE